MKLPKFPKAPKFTRLDIGVGAVSALILALFIGQGGFHFAQPDRFSASWDSLAGNLLHLDASVDKDSIEWEGWVHDGKSYLPNYGIFPAVLRIVPCLLFPGMYGKWARLSCLLAAVLALLAFAWITRRSVDANSRRLSKPQRDRISAIALAGFALATPLFFLMSNARIYHETMVWSLAWAMVALALLLEILCDHRRDKKVLALYFGAVALVLLSRITFGIIFTLTTPIAFWLVWNKKGRRRPTWSWSLAACAGPLVGGWLIQLWYNHQRFGEYFRFADYRGYHTDPAGYGGLYNLARLPSLLSVYFGLTPRMFVAHFPYVHFPRVEYFRPELFYQWREESIAFWLASAWLCFGAALGLRALFRGKWKDNWEAKAVVAIFFGQYLALLTHFLGTHRYQAELMPLAIFAFAYGLRSPLARWLRASLAPLVVLSAYLTIGTTVHWMLFTSSDVSDDFKRSIGQILYPSSFSHPEKVFESGARFAGYRRVDELDVADEASETAHAWKLQGGINTGPQNFVYNAAAGNAVVRDSGWHFDTAQWKIRGVQGGRDLVMLARFDENGTGVYSLSINGRPLNRELWLCQSLDGINAWKEAFLQIPGEFLRDGENELELRRLAKSPSGGAQLYYLWFLQPASTARYLASTDRAAATRLDGFSEIVSQQETLSGDRPAYGAQVDHLYAEVRWRTAPVATDGAQRIDFDARFAGPPGFGYLFVNDELAVRLPVGATTAVVDGGGYRLELDRTGQDTGTYHLYVPAGKLPLGKKTELAVVLTEGEIGTLFAVLDRKSR